MDSSWASAHSYIPPFSSRTFNLAKLKHNFPAPSNSILDVFIDLVALGTSCKRNLVCLTHFPQDQVNELPVSNDVA